MSDHEPHSGIYAELEERALYSLDLHMRVTLTTNEGGNQHRLWPLTVFVMPQEMVPMVPGTVALYDPSTTHLSWPDKGHHVITLHDEVTVDFAGLGDLEESDESDGPSTPDDAA